MNRLLLEGTADGGCMGRSDEEEETDSLLVDSTLDALELEARRKCAANGREEREVD
jgi:hypothetical protein